MFNSVSPKQGAAPRERHYEHSRRRNALVVEDHSDSRVLLKFLLTRLGYTVLEAGDGYKALELAETNHVDLIVTDLGLPGMHGFEFIERVRALKQDQKNLTIIMLTAYDSANITGRDGYDFLLWKPIDLDQFTSLIESVEYQSRSDFARVGTQPYVRPEHISACYKNASSH
jgi:two-component system, OmpR family, response regulator